MKILIAAGGTGGHIYPGLAIAGELAQEVPEAEIVFIGTRVGMEKDIVPKSGYPLEFIRARGFEKGFSMETLAAVKGIFDSRHDAKALLSKHKPALVIGTGGFTCAMLLEEAARRGIPTMIHEQNAYPGRSNRLTGKKVDRIAISFEAARQYFPADKVFLTGNPVREVFKHPDRQGAREALGLKPEEKLVVFMGGSQGAVSINQAAVGVMKADRPGRVYKHLTGKGNDQNVIQSLTEHYTTMPDNIDIIPYSNDVDQLLAAADCVVSRSGAMSVAEIAASGTPSVLVPYPQAAGDHQTFNAKVLEEAGGAVIIPDDRLIPKTLLETLDTILDTPGTEARMRWGADSVKILDSASRFCAEAKPLIYGHASK